MSFKSTEKCFSIGGMYKLKSLELLPFLSLVKIVQKYSQNHHGDLKGIIKPPTR